MKKRLLALMLAASLSVGTMLGGDCLAAGAAAETAVYEEQEAAEKENVSETIAEGETEAAEEVIPEEELEIEEAGESLPETEAEIESVQEEVSEDASMYVVDEQKETDEAEAVALAGEDENWGRELMQFDRAIEYTKDYCYHEKSEVKVAILDTGIDASNRIFAGRISADKDNSNIADDNGHGTQVASIIAQNTPDEVKLLIYKVLNKDNQGYAEDIAEALKDAVEVQKADVVNLSLSITKDETEYDHWVGVLKGYIRELCKNYPKCAIVVSAGNEGKELQETGSFPAIMDEVITVGAVDRELNRYSDSNYGEAVDFSAPGKDVSCLSIGNKKVRVNGTSVAAPFITSAYALLRLYNATDDVSKLTQNLKKICADGSNIPVFNDEFDLGAKRFYYDFSLHTENMQTGTIVMSEGQKDLLQGKSHSIEPGGFLYTLGGSDIIWTSSNESVVKIDENGMIIAVAKGEATITGRAKLDGANDTIRVIVGNAKSSGILADNDKGKINWNLIQVEDGYKLLLEGNGKDLGNTEIGWKGYANQITEVIIGEGITEVRDSLFRGYRNLQKVTLPEGLQIIKEWTFAENPKLKEISIPLSVECIESSAFMSTELETINIQDVTAWICMLKTPNWQYNTLDKSNKNAIAPHFYVKGERLTKLVISNDIENVRLNGFDRNVDIEELIIPNGVTTIDKSIENWKNLTRIEIPATLKNFPTIKGCSKLSQITLESLDTWYYMDHSGVVNNCDYYLGDKLIQEIIISDGVEEIKENTFYGWKSLKKVVLPKNLKVIGKNAFYGCSALEEICIPDTVGQIGEAAFGGCSSLNKVVLPSGITTIERSAFSGCIALTEISLPSSLKEIKENAFKNSGLDTIHVPFLETWAGISKVNNSISNDYRLFVGDEELKTVIFKKEYGEIQALFKDCVSIEKVIVEKDVDAIAEYSFYGCSSLKNVFMEGGGITFGAHAFGWFVNYPENKGCISFEIADVEAWCRNRWLGDESYGRNFYTRLYMNGEELKDVTIPGTVERIENSFKGCLSLEKVRFSEGIKEICASAFSECCNLKEIAFANGLENIGNYAFYDCNQITALVFPEGLKTIGDDAFRGCTQIATLEFSEGLKTIGDRAFSGCNQITSLEFPDSIEVIGHDAFFENKCTEIVLPRNIKVLGRNAICSTEPYTLFIPGSIEEVNPLYIFGTNTGGYPYYPDYNVNIIVFSGSTKKWKVFEDHIKKYYSDNILFEDAAIYTGFLALRNKLLLSNKGICGDNLTWEMEGKPGECILHISGTGAMFDYGSAEEVPWQYAMDDIASIIIDDGVTSISNYAFNRFTKVSSIMIPESITKYGDYSFTGLKNLPAFTVQKGAEKVQIEIQYTATQYIKPEERENPDVPIPMEPGIRVYAGETLTEESLLDKACYDITYENNLEKSPNGNGSAIVVITFKGAYAEFGTVRVPFMIVEALDVADTIYKIRSKDVSLFAVTYNGKLHDAKEFLSVSFNGWTLKEGIDYQCSSREDVLNAKNYSITLSGLGAYAKTDPFDTTVTVNARNLESVIGILQKDTFEETGSEIKPLVGRFIASDDANLKLLNGTDYSLSYKSNVVSGTGYVIVSAVGANCIGSMSIPFRIIKGLGVNISEHLQEQILSGNHTREEGTVLAENTAQKNGGNVENAGAELAETEAAVITSVEDKADNTTEDAVENSADSGLGADVSAEENNSARDMTMATISLGVIAICLLIIYLLLGKRKKK